MYYRIYINVFLRKIWNKEEKYEILLFAIHGFKTHATRNFIYEFVFKKKLN